MDKDETFNIEAYLFEIRKSSTGSYTLTVAENLTLSNSGKIEAVGKQQHNLHQQCLSYATNSMLKKRKMTYSMRRRSIIAVFE